MALSLALTVTFPFTTGYLELAMASRIVLGLVQVTPAPPFFYPTCPKVLINLSRLEPIPFRSQPRILTLSRS